MRITQTTISNQYKRSLNQSLNTLNYYNMRATNFRKFSRASEDPMGAARAYHLRREMSRAESHKSNLEEVESTLLSAQSAMMDINKVVQESFSADCIQAINGTMTKEDRAIIAQKLRTMSESIVMTANSKFADKYMFGGSDIANPPFSVDKDGNMLYRGINVNTGKHVGFEGESAKAYANNSVINFGTENGTTFNGYTLVVNDGTGGTNIDSASKTISIDLDISGGATMQDLQDSLKALGLGDASKISIDGDLTKPATAFKVEITGGKDPIAAGTDFDLTELANEKVFIDLGLGMKFNSSGKIDEQSAFDIALPGLSFLGFGTNKDGISNNVHTLMNDIADMLEKEDFNIDSVQPYMDNLGVQKNNLLSKITEFGSKSNFIDYTKNRLDDNEINIKTKITDVEFVDPAEAIMDFKMQEFSYRAALQMGTKILQPTFLDFMR